MVINAKRGADAFRTIVEATEEDVELVVIDGQRRYGTPDLMSGASTVTALTRWRSPPYAALTEPAERCDQGLGVARSHRQDGGGTSPPEAGGRRQRMRCTRGGRVGCDDREAPLRLALDMPTGLAPVGGLPKDLNELVIPPLQSLTHDKEWIDSILGRGFHSGVLDGLA